MPVERSFDSVNYRIVGVDSYSPMIVRDSDVEDLFVEFSFVIQKPEKSTMPLTGMVMLMSIPPVCDIKRRCTTFYFARQNGRYM